MSPRETLRMLPIVAELGLPSLSITYRNDFWAPKAEDCFYRYGQTEWQDLEGAVSYALEHGADDVVLVGYSYGGDSSKRVLNLRPSKLRTPIGGVDGGSNANSLTPSRRKMGLDWIVT